MSGPCLRFAVPPEYDGVKLGSFLRGRGISLAAVRAQKYLDDGLCVNGVRARTSQPLHAGDEVALHLADEPDYCALPQHIPLDIVYESGAALVVNKPAGMVMHPSPSHHAGTLANAWCGLAQGRRAAGGEVTAGNDEQALSGIFRPVGRLDGGTSGLVLCALNAVVAAPLAKTARKSYLVLVAVCLPQSGEMDAPLGPDPASAVRQRAGEGGRASRTRFETLAASDAVSLARVWPQTGRTHQIRAHFAHAGHPLLGDELYGGDTTALARPALHCAQLVFCEPESGRTVALSCPPPADFAAASGALGLGM